MKRIAAAAFCLPALLLCVAAFWTVGAEAGRPPGQDSRQGTITAFEQQSDGTRLATVKLDTPSAAQANVTVYGAESMEVHPGMNVRLAVILGTAVFSLPVGRVIELSPDGKTCLFAVDEGLLDETMEDPTSHATVKLRDYLRVGAGVSISR